jgi:hypothetical protein
MGIAASLDSLSLELQKHGYIRIVYAEIYCAAHGGWRCAVVESSPLMPCPECGRLHAAAIIAIGYSRHPEKWERWETPLTSKARSAITADDLESKAIRRGNHKPSTRHYVIGARA